jgi:predicted Zn-dependent protease with MMP-like domain
MNQPKDWAPFAAPGIDDFQRMAEEAFAALPDEFRALAGHIEFRVAEFPDDDVVTDMKLDSGFDILGLFQGIGMAHDSETVETGRMPNMIWLYRRPILDYWAEHEETLGAIVSHVLIHEIGHHFGLSDDDMEDLEAAAD